MISPIRPATEQEIEAIKDKADLTPLARVLAFENNLAVIKPTIEVDPVNFDPEAPRHKRALFLWGLEQVLRYQGNSEYYFNVSTENKEFIEDVIKMGCINTSPTPEFRFRKNL
jgi:hypothetical protein